MGDSQKRGIYPRRLKVKYKSADVEDFIQHSGKDLSLLGVFIKTKKPMEEGVPLKFELQLADGTPVIRGVGQVAWRREIAPSDDLPAGMGIKFIKLDSMSQSVVNRAVKLRGSAPSRYDRQGDAVEVAPQTRKEAAVPPPSAARLRRRANRGAQGESAAGLWRVRGLGEEREAGGTKRGRAKRARATGRAQTRTGPGAA